MVLAWFDLLNLTLSLVPFSLDLGGYSDPRDTHAAVRPTGPFRSPLSRKRHFPGFNTSRINFIRIPGLSFINGTALVNALERNARSSVVVMLFTFADLSEGNPTIFEMQARLPHYVLLFVPAGDIQTVANFVSQLDIPERSEEPFFDVRMCAVDHLVRMLVEFGENRKIPIATYLGDFTFFLFKEKAGRRRK
mmetsp:Transcript_13289/g.33693  ORF Transcript_13289/g.33693 Transcript_13289/m.33693 type:complete len:192 (-) Transcript_13289:1332-1907(-)